MRITTWNVNSVRARLDRVLAWWDAATPDLLCLQEIKCVAEQFPQEPFLERGLHLAIAGQKTYNGVALIARRPLTDIALDLPWPGDGQARGISAVVDGVRVVNLYAPNGRAVGSEPFQYKLDWLARLRQWLDASAAPQAPVVVCGDFNVAPDDRDVYDPEALRETVLCSTPEREALQGVMAWGLADAFRAFHAEPGQYTWWDYRQARFRRGQGLRIDYFLVTAPVLAAAEGVTIDVEERRGGGASDHAPVTLTLRPPPAAQRRPAAAGGR